MSVIKDQATPGSIALPISVEICRHPSGGRWTRGTAGTCVEMKLHLDPTGADGLQLMDGVVSVIRRALAATGETLGDAAFIDIRYMGDLTRGCTSQEDDEFIGDEMHLVLDTFFYKSRLYLAPEDADSNCHQALADHVRETLLPGLRKAA